MSSFMNFLIMLRVFSSMTLAIGFGLAIPGLILTSFLVILFTLCLSAHIHDAWYRDTWANTKLEDKENESH